MGQGEVPLLGLLAMDQARGLVYVVTVTTAVVGAGRVNAIAVLAVSVRAESGGVVVARRALSGVPVAVSLAYIAQTDVVTIGTADPAGRSMVWAGRLATASSSFVELGVFPLVPAAQPPAGSMRWLAAAASAFAAKGVIPSAGDVSSQLIVALDPGRFAVWDSSIRDVLPEEPFVNQTASESLLGLAALAPKTNWSLAVTGLEDNPVFNTTVGLSIRVALSFQPLATSPVSVDITTTDPSISIVSRPALNMSGPSALQGVDVRIFSPPNVTRTGLSLLNVTVRAALLGTALDSAGALTMTFRALFTNINKALPSETPIAVSDSAALQAVPEDGGPDGAARFFVFFAADEPAASDLRVSVTVPDGDQRARVALSTDFVVFPRQTRTGLAIISVLAIDDLVPNGNSNVTLIFELASASIRVNRTIVIVDNEKATARVTPPAPIRRNPVGTTFEGNSSDSQTSSLSGCVVDQSGSLVATMAVSLSSVSRAPVRATLRVSDPSIAAVEGPGSFVFPAGRTNVTFAGRVVGLNATSPSMAFQVLVKLQSLDPKLEPSFFGQENAVASCLLTVNLWPQLVSINNRLISPDGGTPVGITVSNLFTPGTVTFQFGGADGPQVRAEWKGSGRARLNRHALQTSAADLLARAVTANFTVLSPKLAEGYTSLFIILPDGGYNMTNSSLFFVSARCYDPDDLKREMFGKGAGDVCVPCPANAHCPGGRRVWPDAGFWNADEGSLEVKACRPPEACKGRPNGELGNTCSEGYQGDVCGQCAPFFYQNGDFCLPCQSRSLVIALIVIQAVFVILLVAGIVFLSIPALSILVQLVTFVQMLRNISSVADPRNLPRWVSAIYNTFFALVTLDVGFAQPGCLDNAGEGSGRKTITAVDIYWFTLSLEVVFRVAIVLGMPIHGAWRVWRAKRNPLSAEIADGRVTWRAHARVRLWRGMIIAFVFSYLNIVNRSIAMVTCERDARRNRWVLSQYRTIECYKGQHAYAGPVAWVILMVNVLILPHLALYLLWRARHQIFPPDSLMAPWRRLPPKVLELVGTSQVRTARKHVIERSTVVAKRRELTLKFGFLFERFRPPAFFMQILALDATGMSAIGRSLAGSASPRLNFGIQASSILLMLFSYIIFHPLPRTRLNYQAIASNILILLVLVVFFLSANVRPENVGRLGFTLGVLATSSLIVVAYLIFLVVKEAWQLRQTRLALIRERKEAELQRKAQALPRGFAALEAGLREAAPKVDTGIGPPIVVDVVQKLLATPPAPLPALLSKPMVETIEEEEVNEVNPPEPTPSPSPTPPPPPPPAPPAPPAPPPTTHEPSSSSSSVASLPPLTPKKKSKPPPLSSRKKPARPLPALPGTPTQTQPAQPPPPLTPLASSSGAPRAFRPRDLAPEALVDTLTARFHALDVNKDGFVSIEDFVSITSSWGQDGAKLRLFFDLHDRDGDGEVTLEEFVDAESLLHLEKEVGGAGLARLLPAPVLGEIRQVFLANVPVGDTADLHPSKLDDTIAQVLTKFLPASESAAAREGMIRAAQQASKEIELSEEGLVSWSHFIANQARFVISTQG